MEQGLYLLCVGSKSEQELIVLFEQFCKSETPEAFLYVPLNDDKTIPLKLVKAVQDKGVAFIVKDNLDMALACQADGVQMEFSNEVKALRKKYENLSLGVVCSLRDDAMKAGEWGADYVAFDGENALELTDWWVDLFTLPCVNFNLETPSAVADFRVVLLVD